MLSSIQLENFKAFGERTIVPLAPITVLFGENSSGKSSVLQSLNLLKQTRESRDVEALLLPRTNNGFTDLGSFQELLFDHQLDRTLHIRLDTTWASDHDRRRYAARGLTDSNGIGLEVSFSRKSLNDEVSLDQIQLFDISTSECLARFDRMEVTREVRRLASALMRPDRRVVSKRLRAAKCSYITRNPKFWAPTLDALKDHREFLIKSLEELYRVAKLRPPDSESVSEQRDEWLFSRASSASLNDIASALDFYKSDFSIEGFIERFHGTMLDTILALDGFVPIRGASLSSTRRPELVAHEVLGRVWRFDWVLDIGQLAASAGRAIEQTLAALYPLGPFRTAPERWYIFTGTSPQDVGYRGHLLPDLLFRRSDLVDAANRWLAEHDMGYQISIRTLGPDATDLFEVRLIDTRRNPSVDVALPDVGFGISQILPFIVQSFAASEQIISIEQPEVHIHPRLQAELGDLLIDAIKEPRNNQFIIETHSEHLALRLQRRVREGILPPDKVAILYVSRGAGGAQIQRLRLDKDGDFLDDFPGGFFPERLQELL